MFVVVEEGVMSDESECQATSVWSARGDPTDSISLSFLLYSLSSSFFSTI